MQHPTLRFIGYEMFASLRRWTGQELPRGEIPIDATLAAMDAASVQLGLLSAWRAPEGVLIRNDDVAGWVHSRPDRFAGLAAVDLNKPMVAVWELRRCVQERNEVPPFRTMPSANAPWLEVLERVVLGDIEQRWIANAAATLEVACEIALSDHRRGSSESQTCQRLLHWGAAIARSQERDGKPRGQQPIDLLGDVVAGCHSAR